MNRNDTDLLNRACIETPCTVDWNSMQGDERTRFCGECKLNVYNVEALTDKETAQLLKGTWQKRVCMRLYRRPDGKLLTDNCPVGLRKIRNRIRTKVALILALWVSLGLIQNVHAQSLIGAPVEPKYGQINLYETSPKTQSPAFLSGITISAIAIWICAFKPNAITTIFTGMIFIVLLAAVISRLGL